MTSGPKWHPSTMHEQPMDLPDHIGAEELAAAFELVRSDWRRVLELRMQALDLDGDTDPARATDIEDAIHLSGLLLGDAALNVTDSPNRNALTESEQMLAALALGAAIQRIETSRGAGPAWKTGTKSRAAASAGGEGRRIASDDDRRAAVRQYLASNPKASAAAAFKWLAQNTNLGSERSIKRAWAER
jgi:hypothetical protein